MKSLTSLIVPLTRPFVPVQAREVAHSGHASHLLFLSSFPSSALSTLRLGKERRSFAEVAFFPVIGVVVRGEQYERDEGAVLDS